MGVVYEDPEDSASFHAQVLEDKDVPLELEPVIFDPGRSQM